MKKTILLLTSMLLLFPTISNAKPKIRDLGFGLILGEPTGASFKTWLNKKNAVDFAIAFGEGLRIHGDYLWHDFTVATVEEGELPLYYGFGLRIKTDTNGGRYDKDEAQLGVRGVLGISYLFEKEPFDIFFELAPVLTLTPSSRFELTAALGARFYLK